MPDKRIAEHQRRTYTVCLATEREQERRPLSAERLLVAAVGRNNSSCSDLTRTRPVARVSANDHDLWNVTRDRVA
ncbi:MAG: hypothetical protein QOG55_3486 [Acidobacteriaceae bacterium]|jgi:hypothetical protein|nr:hypothetical protein [Acidobacteriaceae bacterium]